MVFPDLDESFNSPTSKSSWEPTWAQACTQSHVVISWVFRSVCVSVWALKTQWNEATPVIRQLWPVPSVTQIIQEIHSFIILIVCCLSQDSYSGHVMSYLPPRPPWSLVPGQGPHVDEPLAGEHSVCWCAHTGVCVCHVTWWEGLYVIETYNIVV